MGASFSSEEYRSYIVKFQNEKLDQSKVESLTKFLIQSDVFHNVVSSCSLQDFRVVRDTQPENLTFLVSYVRLLT